MTWKMPTLLCFLSFWLGAAQSAFGQNDGVGVIVAVVPTETRGGPRLGRSTQKFIEKKLRKQVAKVISFKRYRRAAAKLKLRKKNWGSLAGAQKVGQKLAATHVLVLEGQVEKQVVGRRKKKMWFAEVRVIVVRTGEEVFSERFALKRKKITKKMVKTILKALETAWNSTDNALQTEPNDISQDVGSEAEPNAFQQPTDNTSAENEPSDQSGEEDSQDDGVQDTVNTEKMASIQGETPPSEEETQKDNAAPDIKSIQADVQTDVRVDVQTDAEYFDRPVPMLKSYRKGFKLALGYFAPNRSASIEGTRSNNPSYSGQFQPGVSVDLELYPLALLGTGRWWEGFGLYAFGYYCPYSNQLGDGTIAISHHWFAKAGLSYRAVLWESPLATELRFDVGANYRSFPLPSAVQGFIDVRYFGQLHAGAQVSAPLGTRYLILVAGGSYTFLMQPEGETDQLGNFTLPTAYSGWAGFKSDLGTFELAALFYYDFIQTRYGGPTDIEGWLIQDQNVSLIDVYMGISASLGIKF
jgi:hypothetical protein